MSVFSPIPPDENGKESQQSLFLRSDAREVFFGGLPGGSKSKSVVVDAMGLYQVAKLGYPACHHPLYHAVLLDVLAKRAGFAMTRAEAEERKLQQLIRYAYELYPSQGGRASEKGRQWEWQDGGKITFSHMHNTEDYLLWQGHELAYVAFDELPQFSQDQYGGIMPWNRVPENSGLDVFMRATGNPIGPGVPWVRDRFIMRCEPNVKHNFFYEVEGKKIPWSRMFIPSSYRDNPYLNEEYPAAIANMPNPQIREALLNPDPVAAWSVVMGSFFSQFNNLQHVIPRSQEKETLQRLKLSHATRVEGLDYGFRAPFATLWAWEDTEGDVYFTAEHYVREKTIDFHADRIHRIRNAMGWEKDGYKVSNFKTIADPSIWYEGNRAVLKTDKTIGQELQRRGIFCNRANNDIIQGLRVVHDRMYTDGVVPPRLHIFESCGNLINEIVNAITDENDAERIDSDCDDHAIDAMRYTLMYLNKARQPKDVQAPEEHTFANLISNDEPIDGSSKYARSA